MTTPPSSLPRPLFDKLLVLRDPSDTQSAGGIQIPEQNRTLKMTGTVVAAGEGRLSTFVPDAVLRPLIVKVGDRVFFNPFNVTPFTHEGVEYLIMAEDDVLLVLT